MREHHYLKIFSEKETQKIKEKLQSQFGIKEIPGILIKKGAERIFLYQGDLAPKEIINLEQEIPIERAGVYFAKEVGEGIRLSIEGTQILADQITKNIFQLTEKQMLKWMHGNELNLKPKQQGFIVIKYKNDFLGTGKASAEKISNFIPKNRRLKEKG